MKNEYTTISREEWFLKPHFFEILLKSGTLPKKPKIAELGVWIGTTTNSFINKLKENGYSPEYYAIDIFTGSEELQDEIKEKYNGSTLDIFKENLEKNNNTEYVTIIQNTTHNASKNFPDEYFDFIYVDADHEYESVRQDIFDWYPKLKFNRYFAGDDYGPYGWDSVTRAVDSIFPDIDCNHVIFYKYKNIESLIQ